MTSESQTAPLIVIPDAGSLITLACADSLNLLRTEEGEVWIVDMVEHEVIRNVTPASERIGRWIDTRAYKVVKTELFKSYRERLASKDFLPGKANLGALAAQEVMNSLARSTPVRQAIFLFEDHRIARTGFVLPDSCSKVSTRAWLRFLERTGRIESAWSIERLAIENAHAFSTLRFPPDGKLREPTAAYRTGEHPCTMNDPVNSRTQLLNRETAMNYSNPNSSASDRRGPNTVEILRLVVTLDEVRPCVSRTLLIRASSPLSTLHVAIQQAMPWQDCHLHEFEKDGVRYGPDWFLDEEPELGHESERKQLGTLFRSGSDTLRYHYDFGDSWSHTITLDARLPPDLSLRRPHCIDGENRCPPEDVGGVPGYERFLEILSDPDDDEYEAMKEWVGGDIEPTHFDLDAAEKRMESWFPTRNTRKSARTADRASPPANSTVR